MERCSKKCAPYNNTEAAKICMYNLSYVKKIIVLHIIKIL